MITIRATNWRYSTLLLTIVGLIVSGCSTPSSNTKEGASNQRRVVRVMSSSDDAPNPEQLVDSPCGNPNWAKLPPAPTTGDAESDAQNNEAPSY